MRIFIKSFGCSANLADGEVLAGCLAEAGYELVDSLDAAGLVIYNTCAVKGPTENRMMNLLKRVSADKKIIVAGCLPLISFERLQKEVRFNCAIGPAAGSSIIEVAGRVLSGERVIALEEATHAKPSLSLPRQRLNPLISIIPINYGCLGSCAYCCVVFARGRLRSYGIPEIVRRMKTDLDSNVREFWVTSEDTACYGRDLGTNLAELLRSMCDVDGEFKIRVGMMTPNMAMDTLDDLVEVFKNEKIFKFVHLPVQSGDDRVLERMRRLYSVDDFRHIVEAFRQHLSDVTLSTDVICGFPNETEEAFERTVQLIDEVKPDIVNVSKFFARPRTVAVRMRTDFVPSKEIRRRSGVIASLVGKIAIERNQRWVDWSGKILVDEMGKIPDSWVGRNFAYKPVAVRSAENLFGKAVNVKVVDAFSTHLKGEVTG